VVVVLFGVFLAATTGVKKKNTTVGMKAGSAWEARHVGPPRRSSQAEHTTSLGFLINDHVQLADSDLLRTDLHREQAQLPENTR